MRDRIFAGPGRSEHIVLLLACAANAGAGAGAGYLSAWILTFYVPHASERQLALALVVTAIVPGASAALLRGHNGSRAPVAFFTIAFSIAYLWTSSNLDYDTRQTVPTDTIGVFEMAPAGGGAVTGARISLNSEGAWVDISTRGDVPASVILIAPTDRTPSGCATVGELQGSIAFSCAGTSFWVDIPLKYSFSGPALEAAGFRVVGEGTTWSLHDGSLVALPLDVEFSTPSETSGERIFNRVLYGSAAVGAYDALFLASAQARAGETWIAAIETRLLRGRALLGIFRDLTLVLVGAAVAVFAAPASQRLQAAGASADTQDRRPPAGPTDPGENLGGRIRSRSWAALSLIVTILLARRLLAPSRDRQGNSAG